MGFPARASVPRCTYKINLFSKAHNGTQGGMRNDETEFAQATSGRTT